MKWVGQEKTFGNSIHTVDYFGNYLNYYRMGAENPGFQKLIPALGQNSGPPHTFSVPTRAYWVAHEMGGKGSKVPGGIPGTQGKPTYAQRPNRIMVGSKVKLTHNWRQMAIYGYADKWNMKPGDVGTLIEDYLTIEPGYLDKDTYGVEFRGVKRYYEEGTIEAVASRLVVGSRVRLTPNFMQIPGNSTKGPLRPGDVGDLIEDYLRIERTYQGNDTYQVRFNGITHWYEEGTIEYASQQLYSPMPQTQVQYVTMSPRPAPQVEYVTVPVTPTPRVEYVQRPAPARIQYVTVAQPVRQRGRQRSDRASGKA